MATYILLFKNFHIDDIVLDFEVLTEKVEVTDGKLIELNNDEYIIVCRNKIDLELNGKIYYQYRLLNINDKIEEELLETFIMKR